MQNIKEILFHYKNGITTYHNPMADGLNMYVNAAGKNKKCTLNYLHVKQS
jgi:hypothetical protein